MPHAEVAHLGAHHPTKVRNSGLAPPVRRNYKHFCALLATVLSQFLSKRYGVRRFTTIDFIRRKAIVFA